MKINELQTPAILVDLDRMEDNLNTYHRAALASGKQVWPMIKTHKSRELARLQQAAGCTGFLCGTLDEAEGLAAAGIEAKSTPSERTPEYYRTRPCVRYVEACAGILADELE